MIATNRSQDHVRLQPSCLLQKKGFDVAGEGRLDPHSFRGGWREVNEFHCGGDNEHVLVGFIVVSHLFIKNNAMI
jgi:hypothetical protein